MPPSRYDELATELRLSTFAAPSTASCVVDATMDSLRTGNFAINSHQKGAPAVYTTCGNIPIEADATTVQLADVQGSQVGWATLTARGSKTESVVTLAPGLTQRHPAPLVVLDPDES